VTSGSCPSRTGTAATAGTVGTGLAGSSTWLSLLSGPHRCSTVRTLLSPLHETRSRARLTCPINAASSPPPVVTQLFIRVSGNGEFELRNRYGAYGCSCASGVYCNPPCSLSLTRQSICITHSTQTPYARPSPTFHHSSHRQEWSPQLRGTYACCE
jgi:hypothetical protein